ncbi:MAG: Rieske (2Fe-2S) protein [Deltaproteobacteria bacterium]|nr:Rieske (2Fe-2S) protein [Deltaproteobacteria bacterium]
MGDEATRVVAWSSLEERQPARAEVEGVPLVVIRLGDEAHVLHRLCPHRGADLACGTIEGTEIVCAEHGWAFECATGESEAIAGADIKRFRVWVNQSLDEVQIDGAEARAFREGLVDDFDYEL